MITRNIKIPVSAKYTQLIANSEAILPSFTYKKF